MKTDERKKIRCFLNLAIVIFLFLFAFLYIAPFGKISYYKDFSKKNRFSSRGNIYKLSPADRIDGRNRVVSDPVYFYLKTFRNFDKAKLKIRYKIVSDNEKLEDIKLGLLLDKDNWNYKLYPIYNNYLNNYLEDYYVQKDGQTFFLQKENNYEDLDDFLSDNDFSSLLLYNYDLKNNYIIEDYNYSGGSIKTPEIKGSHVFYTYIKEEPLRFEFSRRDINTSVYIYFEDELIHSDIVKEEIRIDDLLEGVCKVEIKAPSSLAYSLNVYSDKLIFLNKLDLYKNNDGFNFYSNKNDFRIKFMEASCLGDISINEELFVFDKILKQHIVSSDKFGLSEIKSDACSFLIENSGFFSFSQESMFEPLLKRLDTEGNVSDFNYIIANYDRPIEDDGYYISEVEVDLKGVKRQKDEYQFIISAPFIDEGEYIEIDSVKIDLFGRSIFDKLRGMICCI